MSDAPERIWLSDTDDVLFEDDEVGTPYTLTSTIPALIAAAVAEELEACAKLAAQMPFRVPNPTPQDAHRADMLAIEIAAAIRARGAK